MSDKKGGYSRRRKALFGLIALAIVIFSLLYYEQIALLYVLATLALVALLLVVGFADLQKVGRENLEN